MLLGSWIILLGQHGWAHLLNVVLAAHLNGSNALPTATLVLFFFLPFVVGYVLAPFAKGVQRANEHQWWLLPRKWGIKEDKPAGTAYDWLRVNNPDAGALSARIRAEFTMYNALSVAFLAITIMACIAGDYYWAIASGLAVPLMAFRGATTEKTFHSTTRKFCKATKGCVLIEGVMPVSVLGGRAGTTSKIMWLSTTRDHFWKAMPASSPDSQHGSLDRHLKQFPKTATAGWVAVVLERAGVAMLDRSRPMRIKLCPGW